MDDSLHMFRRINASLQAVQAHLPPESAGHQAYQQALQDYELSLRKATGFTGKIFENNKQN